MKNKLVEVAPYWNVNKENWNAVSGCWNVEVAPYWNVNNIIVETEAKLEE